LPIGKKELQIVKKVEHVVIVLFVGHEVVVDRQEGVADRQESFEDGLVDGGQEVDDASCYRKFSKSS
jgi:hypothetical protein